MSFLDCIRKALDDGRLSEDGYRQARSLFDEIELDLQNKMHASQVQIEASRMAFDAMRFEKTEARRRELLQARTWQSISKNLQEYRNGKGEQDIAAAVLAHLDRDEYARFGNVEARRKAILGRLHGQMENVMATFRLNIVGEVRAKATLRDMVREAFGENTGNDAAAQLAKAWGQSSEMARKRFNAAGGHIPKRADWGLPQMHDASAVRRVSFQEWRDAVLPSLDVARMIDESTGQAFTTERLQLVLRDVYETIRTDGLNKVGISGQGGGRSLANRRADHRFLVFRSADDWMAYNDRFGVSDAFSSMMGHLDAMARDIASMEVLGPNPTATLRFMDTLMAKGQAMSGGALDGAQSSSHLMWNMWGQYTGSSNAPVNGKMASFFSGTRQILQSAQLGAAALSAVTDVNFQRMARQMSGLSSLRILPQYLKLLNPVNLADQKLAVRLGLVAENWSTHASALNRYVGEISGPEVTRRLADTVMRASLLSPWTQAGRWAFGMEFTGVLADYAGEAFDKLPKALQNTMARYAIAPEHWDIIRATPLLDHKGAQFLRPEDIASRTDLAPSTADDLALRVLEMIQTETEFAVPSTSLRGRAMLKGDVRPGTFQGEIIRSAAMYKNFGVTFVYTHLMRVVAQKGFKNKAAMAMNLAISTSIMGALAIQLKEVSKGRDPRPMGSSDFWGAAVLQGGGLGIFGDFLFSGMNRMDRGLPETIAGPVASFGKDVIDLAVIKPFKAANGEDTNAGRDLIKFVQNYMPGSSLWYSRLALERIMFDQLQSWVDPQAQDRQQRTVRRWQKEFNQRFWWSPGDMAPERGPNMSNALEASDK